VTLPALAARLETLDDVVRAVLSRAPHCLVCGADAVRDPAAAGGHVTTCERCGSVLEEDGWPALRLVAGA
jgi:hypothetical protein